MSGELKVNDYVARLKSHTNLHGGTCWKEDCIACGSANEIIRLETIIENTKDANATFIERIAELRAENSKLLDAKKEGGKKK